MKRLSRKRVAESFGFSTRTIDRRLREIQSLVGVRYPWRSIIWEPSVRVREDVVMDYFENYKQIKAGTAPAFKEET